MMWFAGIGKINQRSVEYRQRCFLIFFDNYILNNLYLLNMILC